MFEDDWVHGSILSLEDQLGRHQGTLGHTERKRDMNTVARHCTAAYRKDIDR